MSISPHHDIDIYQLDGVQEDGDDYQTFTLEFRYSDWTLDPEHASVTLMDELLHPNHWYDGNPYRKVVGSNYAHEVVVAFLRQMVERHDEIVATIEHWHALIAEIEERAK